MPRGTAERGFGPAHLLLGDHDRVEAPPGDRHREAAELAQREAHALEQLRVLSHEEVSSVVAAPLLVGEHAQDHVAGGRLAARSRRA